MIITLMLEAILERALTIGASYEDVWELILAVRPEDLLHSVEVLLGTVDSLFEDHILHGLQVDSAVEVLKACKDGHDKSDEVVLVQAHREVRLTVLPVDSIDVDGGEDADAQSGRQEEQQGALPELCFVHRLALDELDSGCAAQHQAHEELEAVDTDQQPHDGQ